MLRDKVNALQSARLRAHIAGKAAAVATVAAMVAALPLAATAEPAAEDAYGYREAVMTSLKGHIGAASMIVRGLVEDEGFLLDHAQGLAAGVAEIHRVFQEGSAVEDSEALPAIWEKPGEFEEAILKAETATENFRKAVADEAGSEAIDAAFREVGTACRGCHDNFRKDDD